ncbi:MAG TPA: hypothetical protein VL027_07985 [Spongiibacteraceae bacterium]|nr:hypothetical protein [Spongiibacteraceae bacterium]HUH37868.1 hypothetical protein [Spongiibacteraceae bacterium]
MLDFSDKAALPIAPIRPGHTGIGLGRSHATLRGPKPVDEFVKAIRPLAAGGAIQVVAAGKSVA